MSPQTPRVAAAEVGVTHASARSNDEQQAQTLGLVWELWCAGFRHSADLHARLILDGAACRLRELGDVRDVLGVLGVALVVPIVLRVLVSWQEE